MSRAECEAARAPVVRSAVFRPAPAAEVLYSEPPNRRRAFVGKTRVSLCPRPTVPRRHRNRRRGAGAGPFGAPPAPDIPLRATRRTSAGSRGSGFALSCRRCRPPARRRRGSAATPQRSHAGGGSQGCRGRWLRLSLLARPQRPPRSRPPSSRTTAVTVRRKEPAHGFRGEQHELIIPDPPMKPVLGESPSCAAARTAPCCRPLMSRESPATPG